LPKKLLDGKVALITGAGRGIGRDFALAFATAGAKVLINDLGGSTNGEGKDHRPALEVAKEIDDAGGSAAVNFDDVSDHHAAENMVNQAIQEFGCLDIVINNAGILRDVIFHKMTEEDWDSVISVHLKGSFNVSRAAASIFRKKSAGAFVHMTSTSGLIGNYGQANYSAAKLGIVGLSKSIALDMSRFNVRSNCIAPFAWSRMIGTIPVTDEKSKNRVEKLKTMTTSKIAPIAVALCSDKSKVTGQVFSVRNNEVFLMGQSRPIRSIHRSEGWTPETVLTHVIPSMEDNFYDLDRSADVFNWDPV